MKQWVWVFFDFVQIKDWLYLMSLIIWTVFSSVLSATVNMNEQGSEIMGGKIVVHLSQWTMWNLIQY